MGNFIFSNFLVPSIDENANDFQRFLFYTIAVIIIYLLFFMPDKKVSYYSTSTNLPHQPKEISQINHYT